MARVIEMNCSDLAALTPAGKTMEDIHNGPWDWLEKAIRLSAREKIIAVTPHLNFLRNALCLHVDRR